MNKETEDDKMYGPRDAPFAGWEVGGAGSMVGTFAIFLSEGGGAALTSSSLDASHSSFTGGTGAASLSSSALLASHSSLTPSTVFGSSAGAGDGEGDAVAGAGLRGLDSSAGDAGAESLSLFNGPFFLREP